jgi:hypothetical protein
MRAALSEALAAWLARSHIRHRKTAQFRLELLVRLAARAGLQPRLTLTPTP